MKTHTFDKQHQTLISKGSRAWRLARQKTAATLHFACTGIAVPGNTQGAVYGTVDVNDGRWHHVTGVYDGATVRVYVDGKLDASSIASGCINADLCKVLIGESDEEWSDEGKHRTFEGCLDDVRIYDYALTESQIKALSNGEETESPRGTE
jgi:hypothetical protein